MISIIIPAHNEESTLLPLLAQLRTQLPGCELMVADGGSTDRSSELSRRHARVVRSQRNRGLQLNRAARQARGDVLLFLHADVQVPAGALAAVERALQDPAIIGGTFSLEFAGHDLASRTFTRIDQWRRWFGVFYGDAGIFVRRSAFEQMGGFREWPLLEDYEFGQRLIRAGKTVWLPECLLVSSRRWQGVNGRPRLWRTMAEWFFIQLFFLLGVPARWLARWYPPIRRSATS